MSQAEAGSAPDESPSPASLAGQSGQTAPLEPKTLPTGQQDKCETEVETDVDRLGDVAAEEAAESRSEIVYEEEHWDYTAREWLIRPREEQSLNRQNCVLRVLTKLPKDADDIERTTVEVKPIELQKVLELIFMETTAFAWGKTHDIDPKWLFWARPRLQEIEAKFAQPDYPEMRHQRLQAMVKVAIRFSDEHYATTISSRYSISEDSENLRLQFDALWSIFPPNVLVTGADRYLSHSRVWRVIHASYRPATPLEGESFGVLVSFEEWNGLEYGSTVEVKKIKAYSGARPLDELSIMPLHLKRDRASICSNILSRSARQMALHGFQNKLQEYSSNGIVLNREKEPWVLEKFHFRGKIMIDPARTLEAVPDGLIPKLRPTTSTSQTFSDLDVNQPDGMPYDVEPLLRSIDSILNHLDPLLDPEQPTAGTMRAKSFIGALHPRTKASYQVEHRQSEVLEMSPKALPRSRQLLLSGIVYGYSFSSQLWGGFSISEVQAVEWDASAFDALVMEPHFKAQLGFLVSAYSKYEPAIDDFIRGKGRGLIGLLFGQPGLGKTFTAEAIAQMAQLPLMSISAGALGAESTDIDVNLKELLQLAARWKAVVLFDEADVFMSKRDSNSIERNAVVSVFLRELEYFSGIMLLTTNKERDIDQAFRSRIHFCYQYPALDSTAREKIWKGFISQATRSGSLRVDIKSAGYEDLASLQYNGRQIKNIMTMASMLALERSPPVLTTNSIMDVANTFQNWDDLERPAKRDIGLVGNSTSESPFANTLSERRGMARMTAAYLLGWTSLAILVLGLASGFAGGSARSILALLMRDRLMHVE